MAENEIAPKPEKKSGPQFKSPANWSACFYNTISCGLFYNRQRFVKQVSGYRKKS